MKTLNKLFIFIVLLSLSSTSFSQFGYTPVKTKIKASGSLSEVKGNKINLVFVYDGMAVGKFQNEADYIKKKVTAYNEKEAGRGDRWAKAWKDDRVNRFEPSFVTKFNELGAKTGTSVEKDNGSLKYTLEVKTTFTDPGYNVGVSRYPAIIDAVCTFKSGTSVIGTITVTKCPGQSFGGYDFDTGVRLSEAYEKLAKEIGNYCAKKYWK